MIFLIFFFFVWLHHILSIRFYSRLIYTQNLEYGKNSLKIFILLQAFAYYFELLNIGKCYCAITTNPCSDYKLHLKS